MNVEQAKKREFNANVKKIPMPTKINFVKDGVPTAIRVGHDYGNRHLNTVKGDSYLNIHGCSYCIWNGTKECPHDIGIKKYKNNSEFHKVGELVVSHSNDICSVKTSFIETMRDELNDGKPNGLLKERVFKQMLDDVWIANYKTRAALKADTDGDEDIAEASWKMALDWRKFTADLSMRWLKQSEGSKVTVAKALNPVDFAKMVEELE